MNFSLSHSFSHEKKICFFHCAKKHSFFIFAVKSHRKCDAHCFFVSYQHFVLFHNVKTVLFQKFENANLTQRHIVTNALFRTIFLFREKKLIISFYFRANELFSYFFLFFALMIINNVFALTITTVFFLKR